MDKGQMVLLVVLVDQLELKWRHESILRNNEDLHKHHMFRHTGKISSMQLEKLNDLEK